MITEKGSNGLFKAEVHRGVEIMTSYAHKVGKKITHTIEGNKADEILAKVIGGKIKVGSIL
jgi:hypothetical protein